MVSRPERVQCPLVLLLADRLALCVRRLLLTPAVMPLELAQRLVHSSYCSYVLMRKSWINAAVLHLRESRHVASVLLLSQAEVLLRLAWIEAV